MTEMRQFTDEELTAYLDGESEPSQVRVIDAESASRPELKQRLRDLEIDRDAIAGAFRSLLETAPEMPELPGTDQDDTRENAIGGSGHLPAAKGFRVFAAVAACLALLVLGAGGGFLVSENREDGWRDYVAAYQALYVSGTLSHLKTSPAQQVTELSRVGKALGKEFDLASLQSIEQLDYKRAQTLGFEGRALVQLAFMSKVGAPVALCIIRSTGAPEARSQIRYETIEGMRAAHWGGGGFEYLLIGGTDAELITAAATYFSKTL